LGSFSLTSIEESSTNEGAISRRRIWRDKMRSSETFVREWAERVLKKIIEGKGELDKEGGEVAPPFASFLYLPLQALEK
jgi:hypothetical protein